MHTKLRKAPKRNREFSTLTFNYKNYSTQKYVIFDLETFPVIPPNPSLRRKATNVFPRTWYSLSVNFHQHHSITEASGDHQVHPSAKADSLHTSMRARQPILTEFTTPHWHADSSPQELFCFKQEEGHVPMAVLQYVMRPKVDCRKNRKTMSLVTVKITYVVLS